MPIFKGIYKTLGARSPATDPVDISNTVVHFFPFVLVGLVLLVLGMRWFVKRPDGRVLWDTTKLKLPIFGGLARKTALLRFSSTLSALFRAGVPVLEALDITRRPLPTSSSPRDRFDHRRGQAGEPLAAGLSGHPVFPSMVTHMISVGEETGALDDMLAKVSTFLDEEIERTVEALTSLLEPLMIVVLGGAVGAMVICLYLPMFNVDTLVNKNQ